MNQCASEFGESWSERGFPCENDAEFQCLDCGQAKCGDCAADCQAEGHEVNKFAAQVGAQRVTPSIATAETGDGIRKPETDSAVAPIHRGTTIVDLLAMVRRHQA